MQQAGSVVFEAGTHGRHTFRIPAIVRGPDGGLVAFAEGRRDGAGDSGAIDVLACRSDDLGATWDQPEVVTPGGSGTAGNPCPVGVPGSSEGSGSSGGSGSGGIVLLTTHNPGDVTEADILAGRGERRVCVQRLRGGRVWSRAYDITDTVRRPAWRWYATGPGHGIALQGGRIVVPANHSAPDTGYGAHAILSDDGGVTWRIGAVDVGRPTARIEPNESSVAELPDGRLVFDSRNQARGASSPRLRAISSDGGQTYDPGNDGGNEPGNGDGSTGRGDEPLGGYRPAPGLQGPIVQASLLATGPTLWFSMPSLPSSRARLSVRRSDDGGASWREAYVPTEGPAAYSDLIDLGSTPDGRRRIGVLYECGARSAYERIRFATFTFQDTGA